ncbi:MAG: hypothetical protein LBE33_05115 [Zoogloeaceae bacterium]|jgi:hypothetical protein|nr:hypothetical protein [Zoogloeaceae bacterium]
MKLSLSLRITYLVAAALALTLTFGAAAPVGAETLACPDPATAVQVGVCPAEEELRYTFTAYCADDARMYGKDKETCASFEDYRKLKNIALWESADGVFQAYISCDLPANTLKTLKPASIALSRQGKLTRLACVYPEDVVFTYRTKATCAVRGDGQCAGNPANCEARCD